MIMPDSGPLQTAGGSVLWKEVESDFYMFTPPLPPHLLGEAMETFQKERILKLGRKMLKI